MNKNDRFGLGQAYITNAKYNVDPTTGYANINVTLNNQSVPGDVAVNIPHCFPYGFISLPPDNSYCLTGNIASTSMSPIVLGGIPNNDNFWTLNALATGEAALYNIKYSLQATLAGLIAQLNNSNGENTATMLYGENIVKVLLDILNYLQSQNTVLLDVISYFNAHTHGFPAGPGLTPGTEDPDTLPYPPVLVTDAADLTAGKAYINNDGEPM